MVASKVVLRTSRVLLLDATDSPDSFEGPSYQLKWRFNKLWVRAEMTQHNCSLPALSNTQWLQECLEHSSIQAVCLDPKLGEEAIRRWANACKESGKSVFLRLPSTQALPKRRKPLIWQTKRVFDWLIAIAILAGFSPFLLMLTTLVWWLSPNAIFIKEWAIGYRGKLFQLYKFNVAHSKVKQPHLCRWIQRCGLDKLPQLVHVINGEMSLVGLHICLLDEMSQIIQSSPDQLLHLRTLPGITGTKQIKARISTCDECNSTSELQYLSSWTLTRDIKFLLLAVPKAILGLSTY